MQEKEIGAMIRYAPAGRVVKQYIGFFPSILLSATISPITRTVLKVDLVITPDFVWKDRWHDAAQRWWILVEESLLAINKVREDVDLEKSRGYEKDLEICIGAKNNAWVIARSTRGKELYSS